MNETELTVLGIRAAAWTLFAAGFGANHIIDTPSAAKEADDMLAEFEKRFPIEKMVADAHALSGETRRT